MEHGIANVTLQVLEWLRKEVNVAEESQSRPSAR
jgi:hypothetical protein